MRSFTTDRFWKLLEKLPESARRQAKEAYRLFQANPDHPGLQFKPVSSNKPIFSVRITLDYRAVGVRDGSEILWFWVGNHSDYDRLIAQL